MNIKEFEYNLPEELIAKYPPKERGTSKLLVLNRKTGSIKHKRYFNIPEYIKEGDVVVLNETKVLNCRTYFNADRLSNIEVMFLEDKGNDEWEVLMKKSRKINVGDILQNNEIKIEVIEKLESGFKIKFLNGNSDLLFSKYGHTPIPPYMKRKDNEEDKVRYNTVFANTLGAVAAPTASLNLTDEILHEIENKGAKVIKIELKVGWGTFAPVREEDINDHKIHTEYINVSKESAEEINKAILNGGRVWAFGTTVARTLESIAEYDQETNRFLVKEYNGYTNLYIYPGYNWKVVDCLVTNFHKSDSSLILLVSSFTTKENILNAYKEAIKNKYKFLSYGDSMLISNDV